MSIIYTCLFCMLVGVFVVISNSSPYFAALGLVIFAGMGCGLMVICGIGFLALILFLIYLGGMLVVFAYTSALASDPYPEVWERPGMGIEVLMYMIGGIVVFWFGWLFDDVNYLIKGEVEVSVLGKEMFGVVILFEGGGVALVVTAGVLLVMLFVVLELTRGGGRGTLRGV
nr:NADH dehydrogenase subunit 6 [Priolepis farcimen]